MLPARATNLVAASTSFNLLCVCLIIIFNPIKAQAHSLPDKFPPKIDSDYVTPIKHNQWPLSDKNDSNSLSGNFRHESNKTWDTNPNYIFKAFDQLLHLVLKKDSSFISKDVFGIFEKFDNHTEKKDLPGEDYLECFYNGHVKGDNQSSVAVSLCQGMTGYIKTSLGSLLIEPANNQTDFKPKNANDTSEILHKIWRFPKPAAKYIHSVAGINLEQNQTSSVPDMKHGKGNSETKSLITELLVAVDPSMRGFHKQNMWPYVYTLISMTSNLFTDESFGNPLKIMMTKIVPLKYNEIPPPDSDAAKDLCNVLRKKGYHFDAAILLKRGTICNERRNKKCKTLGFAVPGSICTDQACSIIRDSGLQTAFTIAHELGHMLNIPHDDDFLCEEFNKKNGQINLNVMSSVASNDSHPWMWSDCSRHYFYEFVEQQNAKCLEDAPKKFIKYNTARLPGELYSLNRQCQLIYDQVANSYCAKETDAPCQILRCYNKKSKDPCRTNNANWADGTPCTDKKNWCQKGKCVARQK